MWSKIVNPETGRKVSIYGTIGIRVLKKYVINALGGGKGSTGSTGSNESTGSATDSNKNPSKKNTSTKNTSTKNPSKKNPSKKNPSKNPNITTQNRPKKANRMGPSWRPVVGEFVRGIQEKLDYMDVCLSGNKVGKVMSDDGPNSKNSKQIMVESRAPFMCQKFYSLDQLVSLSPSTNAAWKKSWPAAPNAVREVKDSLWGKQHSDGFIPGYGW